MYFPLYMCPLFSICSFLCIQLIANTSPRAPFLFRTGFSDWEPGARQTRPPVCCSTSHSSGRGSGPVYAPLDPSGPGRSSLLLLLATSRPGYLDVPSGSRSPVHTSTNSPVLVLSAQVPRRAFPARTLSLYPLNSPVTPRGPVSSYPGDPDCTVYSHGILSALQENTTKPGERIQRFIYEKMGFPTFN